jgi:PAS domain S-box-containing protein
MPTSDDQLLVERESLASLVTKISHILTADHPLDRILQQCTESLVWHLDVALVEVWLLDASGDSLVLAASTGNVERAYGQGHRMTVSSSVDIGAMMEHRRPRLTYSLQEQGWLSDPEWAKQEGLMTYVEYPLIVQDRVIGVMAMFSRYRLGNRTLEELGGIAGWIAQCVRRSQNEQALRRNEERLALAVEGAGMALWDWDLRSDEVVWSAQFYALLGYEPSTVVPSREAWQQRVHPDDRERVLQEIDASRHGQTPLNHDYRIITADRGELLWVAGRGKFVYDDTGDGVRLIGALFNINHRKSTEAEIRRLLNEAQHTQQELREKQAQLVQTAKLASVGELTTGLAHELNNPLNNIALFVGNALDVVSEQVTGVAKDRLADQLRAAEEQVNRAATIINHLRMFGRSGKQEFVPVEINAVIKASLKFLSERLRVAQIEITLILDISNPLVNGCQIRLEQVLVNLLTNAIDAVKGSPNKRLTVSSQVTDRGVVVCIHDTGTGICPEHLTRIFDPFFTTKEVGDGTGLGLSIAFGIIKDHHGDITVDSRLGYGTTFTILLPVSASSPQ